MPHLSRFKQISRYALMVPVLAAGFLVLGTPATPAAAASSDLKPLTIDPNAFRRQGNTFVGNYLSGRHAQRERDLTQAQKFLLAALEQEPGTPNLLRHAFLVTLIEGKMDKALELAKRYAREEPGQPLATYTIAAEHLKAGRFKQAEQTLGTLANSGLNVFARPLLEAWTQFGQGQTEKALTTVGTLTQRDAAANIVDVHLGLLNELSGNTAEAQKSFLRVVERQSSPSPRVTHLLGALYERTGAPDRAKALYTLYLDNRPDSRIVDGALERIAKGGKPIQRVKTAQDGAAEAFFGLANSLGQQNLSDTALALGQLALYLKPDFPAMQYLLADVMQSAGRAELAVGMYDSIRSQSAYYWSAQLHTANLLDSLDRLPEARNRLAKLKIARPELPEPHLQLGDLLRGREKFKEAVVAYDEAIKRVGEIQQHHWSLYYARGIVLERAKLWNRAEKDLEKALELQPDHPYVLNYLGYSWIDQGLHLDKGKEMIKKAVSLAPRDGFIADSLGWAYYKLGDYEKAVTELERAIELEPQDPVINDHLGDAYWRVGRTLEAGFQWNRSLSLNPEADLIPKIKEKIKNGLKE